MTDHKTVREAWEIVKGVVKSLERQAEWTKEEIHNNEPVAEAFNTLDSVINCNASNDVTDLLDYYDVIWRQASGVDVERDRKIRFAIAALDRIEAVETVTVEQMTSEINSWAFDDSNPHEKFSEHLASRYPNGLRIVQASRQPEQPAAPINQAYEG